MKVIRPPISRFGGKGNQLPWILRALPGCETFVDVFGGSGIVTLNVQVASRRVYNDLDKDLSDFFYFIKSSTNCDKLLELCFLTPHSKKEFYYQKELKPETDLDKNFRLMYLNSASHGTKMKDFARTTSTTTNRQASRLAFKRDILNNISAYLLRTTIENLSFSEVIKKYDSNKTVFYCDPPYYDTDYYNVTMTKDEHRDLVNLLHEVDGYCVLSGYHNPIYNSLQWDSITEESYTFKINKGRKAVTEVLWVLKNNFNFEEK